MDSIVECVIGSESYSGKRFLDLEGSYGFESHPGNKVRTLKIWLSGGMVDPADF